MDPTAPHVRKLVTITHAAVCMGIHELRFLFGAGYTARHVSRQARICVEFHCDISIGVRRQGRVSGSTRYLATRPYSGAVRQGFLPLS